MQISAVAYRILTSALEGRANDDQWKSDDWRQEKALRNNAITNSREERKRLSRKLSLAGDTSNGAVEFPVQGTEAP